MSFEAVVDSGYFAKQIDSEQLLFYVQYFLEGDFLYYAFY